MTGYIRIGVGFISRCVWFFLMQLKRMTLTADGKGAIFDVATDQVC